MTAGFQQHGTAIVIRIFLEPGDALDNRLSGNLRQTLRDQTKGFAASMQLDCR